MDCLRDKKAILIYISDHSECMGEDGLYTHGVDHDALHHPASFVWFSNSYQHSYGDKVEALRKNRNNNYNSSFLFHSVLSAGNINTDVLNMKENIFR